MITEQFDVGQHYDVHNLFGWSQSRPTLEGVREATGWSRWSIT